MYINPEEKYYFYALQTDKTTGSHYWQLRRRFENKKELIEFLANSVDTNGYADVNRWSSEYFKLINVTGEDTHVNDYTTFTRDSRGFRLFVCNREETLRPYYFMDSHERTIDVRKFKNEVFAFVHARLSGLVPEKKYFYDYGHRYRRGPKSHHAYYHHSNSHFYRRFLNTHTEEYEDDNIYVKFSPKPKDIEAKYKWSDDFWRRGECGWKTHKHKKQWMHRLGK